ncbi:hypothetical protein CS063_15780 [Sporanaerobium hydrogeniformans]|uniref:Uncharacterized protein n=1 Tax=Sporanaerobium hydrogeniformans TaxID=3072179 RepID=A0AC61D766_9FIRM|nr:hypothetical protein [Sporanaerobium hydrogeniformans]PHV69454.1 hypothetical protein CS063_15780 [Sporanaerobium hydrogeniformans]
MKKLYQVFLEMLNLEGIEEQRLINKALIEKGCMPVGQGSLANLDDREMKIVQELIEDSDYYLLVIGNKPHIETASQMAWISHTLESVKRKGLPILIYAYQGEACFDFIQKEQSTSLQLQMEKVKKEIWCEDFIQQWTSKEELYDKILSGIWNMIEEQPQVGWIRGDCIGRQVLLEEIKKLQLEKRLMVKHIEELEEQLAATQVQNEQSSTDESQLGYFQIFGTYKEDKQGVVFNWKEVLNLDQLFATWGSFLIEAQKDKLARTRLTEIICREYRYGMKYSFEIEDKAYEQLKRCLGHERLLKNFEVETTGGGVTEFLKLTEKGKRLLNN